MKRPDPRRDEDDADTTQPGIAPVMSEGAPASSAVASANVPPADAALPPDLGLLRALDDDGKLDPAFALPETVVLRAYREMRRLRLIDARMILLQRQGRVGFYGACEGQEAVPIATGLVVDKGDWVFPALREQSVMLVRGFPIDSFIAQVFGNSGDVLKGRQMPSHHSGRSVNQVSWSSCIGPQIPQAVGAAWAMKLDKNRRPGVDPSCAIGFCGDGATSQADFHVAMTFAARFQVPCVIICQNNHWSISVPTEKQTASKTIAVKGRAYGIPAVRVDGNDLFATAKVIKEALARARAGGGPTFIEALTYRIGAHSTSDDPTRYRSNEEVESWRRKDPLDRLKKYVYANGLMTAAKDEAMEAEITRDIAEAVNKVEALPPPDRHSLFEDVYKVMPWNLREQAAELAKLPPVPPQH